MAKGGTGTGKRDGQPRSTTKAQVHDVFSERLDELRENSKNQYKAFQGSEQRKWQVPEELTEDLFQIDKLHDPPWDREPINTNYEEVMQDVASPGTNGDVISLKLQMDYNASEERAFRVRHSSICRSLAHSMGRRFGQGEGRTFTAIRDQAASVIAAGST